LSKENLKGKWTEIKLASLYSLVYLLLNQVLFFTSTCTFIITCVLAFHLHDSSNWGLNTRLTFQRKQKRRSVRTEVVRMRKRVQNMQVVSLYWVTSPTTGLVELIDFIWPLKHKNSKCTLITLRVIGAFVKACIILVMELVAHLPQTEATDKLLTMGILWG